MVEHLMNDFFSHCVLDKVLLNLIIPLGTQLMQLDRYLSELIHIECFVNFAKPTFSK